MLTQSEQRGGRKWPSKITGVGWTQTHKRHHTLHPDSRSMLGYLTAFGCETTGLNERLPGRLWHAREISCVLSYGDTKMHWSSRNASEPATSDSRFVVRALQVFEVLLRAQEDSQHLICLYM